MTPSIRRRCVRGRVLDLVARDAGVTKAAVVVKVALLEEVSVGVVREALGELEREGEVYLVGDGGGAEVRRP